MGCMCCKPSNGPDPFAQPGRTVGTTPPSASTTRATVPPKISSQGRPLGGTTSSPDASDARRAAAKAAQERATRANQPKGKLGKELAKEKQQTRTSTLGEASKEERRRRDADEGQEARNWN